MTDLQALSDVTGQVAIVTGGTQGIGLACAERFAAAGAKVVVTGRTAANGEAALAAIKRHGEHALYLQCDSTSGLEMQEAVAAVERQWGRVDILVNCAGGFSGAPRLDALDEDGWRKGIEWNLTSKFLAIRLVAPIMKRAGYGRIVNVTSVAGRGGVPGAPIDYSAAKAGVDGLTRRLASELGPSGITVNSVAPGTTMTPRLSRMTERRMEQVVARIPVGRLGKPEEIAHGIFFLCTPGAGYVNGAVIDMNGGSWTG